MSSQSQVPATPHVIAPSPTPSDASGKDGYFAPTTRARAGQQAKIQSVIEQAHRQHDPELDRARSRSRSPQLSRKALKQTKMNGNVATGVDLAPSSASRRHGQSGDTTKLPNGESNDLLSPNSALQPEQRGFGASYWRDLSRSPSPFGLIPIHREWRTFIHKHEVPRKVLHVSIGFVTLYLYVADVQTSAIHPVLLGLLVPIFTVDLVRFRWQAFNSVYIRAMGALMRESEAHDRFNGVISYLAGLWFTMRFCRKDVAVMSVLLLSWCDTAASTFGRLYGKYTPRIRRGKSLAGSLAAFAVGVVTAVLFWGLIAPNTTGTHDEGSNSFAFNGQLTLPSQLRDAFGLSRQQATIEGVIAMAVLAIVSGFVASVSEAIDILGLDDNLTIPILSGLGLGAILWAFSDG
nr:ctp-dependent diacylglycerol kinase 1 [Quercus suber]